MNDGDDVCVTFIYIQLHRRQPHQHTTGFHEGRQHNKY